MSISAAEVGIKAPGISLSESFGNARGMAVRARHNIDRDFAAEDTLNTAAPGYSSVMQPSSDLQFSPLAATAGSQKTNGQDQNGPKTTEDVMGKFVTMMKDTRTSPAQDKLDNSKYHDNIGAHLKTAEGRSEEATQKLDDLKTAAKDTAKHLTATGQESLAMNLAQSQGQPGKGLGIAGGMALEAGIVGAASLVNPVLGAGVGAAMMAKTVMDTVGQGQGSEVTFNKTSTAFTPSMTAKPGSKNAKNADAGYFRSEPAAPQPGTTMTASAPESNMFNAKMSRGAGFGKFDLPRAELTEQSLEGMMIKIAEDSPAGKVATKMAQDSRIELDKHELRAKNGGVDPTIENIARAPEALLHQEGPKVANIAPKLT